MKANSATKPAGVPTIGRPAKTKPAATAHTNIIHCYLQPLPPSYGRRQGLYLFLYPIVRKSSKTSAAIFLINKTACWLLAKISRTVPTHSLPPHPFRWQREAEKFIVSLCDVDYSLHSSDDQPLELLWNSPSKVSFPGVRLWSTVASFQKTEAQRKPSVRKL